MAGGSNEPVLERPSVEPTTLSTNTLTQRDPLQEQTAELRQKQMEDEDIEKVISWMKTKERPQWESISLENAAVKTMWAMWDTLTYQNDVLYRKYYAVDRVEPILQIILPKTMRPIIFQQLHAAATGGHLGRNKTLSCIQERYHWYGLSQDVKDWCSTCPTCQCANPLPKKNRSALCQYQVGEPLERVALDLTGPFPVSTRNNTYLLVMCDYFTRWIEVVPVPDITAETIARAFVENFICRFGTPLEILTDQGRQFESNLFKEVCELLEISKTRGSPWRPQTNGLVERCNRTIGQMLRKFVAPHQKDWDVRVQYLLIAYRSTKNASTEQTPCRMMLGRDIRRPVDLMVGGLQLRPQPDGEGLGTRCSEYVQELANHMYQAHVYARKQLRKNAKRQKETYDRHLSGKSLKKGEKVLLYHPLKMKGKCPKLQMSWKGPFTIMERIGDLNYRIQKERGKLELVHRDRLKPYYGN